MLTTCYKLITSLILIIFHASNALALSQLSKSCKYFVVTISEVSKPNLRVLCYKNSLSKSCLGTKVRSLERQHRNSLLTPQSLISHLCTASGCPGRVCIRHDRCNCSCRPGWNILRSCTSESCHCIRRCLRE